MIIKICGLKKLSHVEVALDTGADWIGFVFAPSPRQITPDRARLLLRAVGTHARAVAVFRTPDPEVLARVLDLGVHAVQADASWEPDLPPGVEFLPVFNDGPDLAERTALYKVPILVDGPNGGGMGISPDLGRVKSLVARQKVVLAGGLLPDTVEAAIRRVRPYGVDVSSGVESEPGEKDPALIRAFVAAVRAAEEEQT